MILLNSPPLFCSRPTNKTCRPYLCTQERRSFLFVNVLFYLVVSVCSIERLIAKWRQKIYFLNLKFRIPAEYHLNYFVKTGGSVGSEFVIGWQWNPTISLWTKSKNEKKCVVVSIIIILFPPALSSELVDSFSCVFSHSFPRSWQTNLIVHRD